jgi:hypothetical protein
MESMVGVVEGWLLRTAGELAERDRNETGRARAATGTDR